jgi:hypothetical protein
MKKEKTIGIETYYITGCAVRSDIVYLATQLEDVDPTEYTHTRINFYAGRLELGQQWLYHDVNSNIVSVCQKKSTEIDPHKMASLSKEGEVEFWTTKDGISSIEKIPSAGLRLGDLGYMCSIREIGNTLFACGYNSQVYMRQSAGAWKSMVSDPLRHCHAASDDYLVFNQIDGFSEQDLYVAGADGALFHWDGNGWQKIPLPADENLECIRCYGTDEVWIGGANGTLLMGNAAKGFRDVSGVDDNYTFWSLAKFNNKIYLGAVEGLFAYDGRAIVPVATGLKPEVETYTVDSTEGALWSIGTKDLVRFDGTTWTRIDDPDNPPIRP